MGTIYVVWGDNGCSYSDHDEWPIAAYADKAMAEEHARLAGEWIAENIKANRQRAIVGASPYDQRVNRWSYHYIYSVRELDLLDALPQGGG